MGKATRTERRAKKGAIWTKIFLRLAGKAGAFLTRTVFKLVSSFPRVELRSFLILAILVSTKINNN